jgi:hypothetical protein
MRTCTFVGNALSAVLSGGAMALAQTGILDQSSPATSASYNLSTPSLTWQQQIRVGIAGQLEGIRLTLVGPVGAQMEVRIRVGGGWNLAPAASVHTVVKVTASTETVFLDTTAANIQLAVDDLLVFEAQGNDTGMNIVGSYVEPPGAPLYPEPLFLNGSAFQPGWRHGFDSFMLTGGVCYANCDESTTPPVLNVADFSCFLQRFAAGDSYANCDLSTTPPVLNVADFGCFLQAFAAGCP